MYHARNSPMYPGKQSATVDHSNRGYPPVGCPPCGLTCCGLFLLFSCVIIKVPGTINRNLTEVLTDENKKSYAGGNRY